MYLWRVAFLYSTNTLVECIHNAFLNVNLISLEWQRGLHIVPIAIGRVIVGSSIITKPLH